MASTNTAAPPGPYRVPLHPRLAPYIESILIQEPAEPPSVDPAPYLVLPKPAPVMGFQYRGRPAVLRGDAPEALAPAGLTGVQTEPRRFLPEGDTRTVLVTLKPYGAVPLLTESSAAFTGQHVSLASVLSPAATNDLGEQLAETTSAAEAMACVERFLLRLARTARCTVPAPVIAATACILRAHGAVRVAAVARAVDRSPRQLERDFHAAIGLSPKQFASIARFDWAAGQLRRQAPGPGFAFAAGYADQAHFIHEFNRYAGVAPGRLASLGLLA